jgi:hypothetical protein
VLILPNDAERLLGDRVPRPSQLWVPINRGSTVAIDLISRQTFFSSNWRVAAGPLGPFLHAANFQTIDLPTFGTVAIDTAPASFAAVLCGTGSGDGILSPIRAASSPAAFSFSGSDLVFTARDSSASTVLTGTVASASSAWSVAVTGRLNDTGGQELFVDGRLIASASGSAAWATSTVSRIYGGTTGSRIGFLALAVWRDTDIGSSYAAELSATLIGRTRTQRRIWVPVSAGGATTYTLSAPTYVPGSITSTGLTARVTVTAA